MTWLPFVATRTRIGRPVYDSTITPLSSTSFAGPHQAADYFVRVRRSDGARVGEVLRDGCVVWTSPLTALEARARELAQEHIGALCGLRDARRH